MRLCVYVFAVRHFLLHFLLLSFRLIYILILVHNVGKCVCVLDCASDFSQFTGNEKDYESLWPISLYGIRERCCTFFISRLKSVVAAQERIQFKEAW